MNGNHHPASLRRVVSWEDVGYSQFFRVEFTHLRCYSFGNYHKPNAHAMRCVGVFPFRLTILLWRHCMGETPMRLTGGTPVLRYCFGGMAERTMAPLSGLTTRIEKRSTASRLSVLSDA